MKHYFIPLNSTAEWKESLTGENALKGIKHAFAHTWENCYAMHLTTGLKTFLYKYESDNVKIICPISERKFENYTDIVTPYGFSGFAGNGDDPEFPQHWKNFAKQQGYVSGYIGLNPIFENQSYSEIKDLYPNKTLYFLDLTLSEEKLFSNLSSNRKRQLKDWENIEPQIITDKPILTEFLLENYIDFFNRKNASSIYHLSKETLTFIANLENAFLCGIKKSDRIEAVSLFAYTPYSGEFLFNVSVPEGRHHSFPLLWYSMKYLKSRNIPFLNLGGGIAENDGVAQFKKRFGGTEFVFHSLKQIYNSDVYNSLCRQNNVDPEDLTGYFPAYRK
jgi:hypothetical protein